MKVKSRKLNKSHGWLSLILLVLMVFIGASCGSSSKKDKDKTEALTEEVQDVKEAVEDLVAQEKADIKKSIESAISDANEQLSTLEQKIKDGERKLDAKTTKLMNDIKVKRDSLSEKLSEIENQTDESWEEFKKEMEHDIQQFKSSISDFFEDNI
ncbi:MAG TPA: hypothetical protein ENN61_01890 [Bacteroidaceae bacterium]|nr:hypothetical protein [Bacteroidaceae bacterium]